VDEIGAGFHIPFENPVDALLRGDLGLKVQVRFISGKGLELFTEWKKCEHF
jgi:hypothetical protein